MSAESAAHLLLCLLGSQGEAEWGWGRRFHIISHNEIRFYKGSFFCHTTRKGGVGHYLRSVICVSLLCRRRGVLPLWANTFASQ